MAERRFVRLGAPLLTGVLALAAVAIACVKLGGILPPERWPALIAAPDVDDMSVLVAIHSLAPRLAVAVLTGAALGLSGALLQQTLRNPLAEPGTLGVFAGARLALSATTLWAPQWLAFGYAPVAFAGGAAGMGTALLLSRRQGFAPLAVILAGVVVSLALEAANKMLAVSHYEQLSDLMFWQAGSLAQNDWSVALTLAPALVLIALCAAAFARPLALLDLEEDAARGLGAGLPTIRIAALTLALAGGGLVAANVGTVGFIGLAGPAIARAAGARRFRERLLWGSACSAALLALADQATLALAGSFTPTGQVVALLGAPLLVWLVWRMRATAMGDRQPPIMDGGARRTPSSPAIVLVVALAAAAVLGLSAGRLPDGWFWATGPAFVDLLPWRAPRVAAALAAGFLLGGAGAVLQRASGNPMASPELLGVSSGAGLVLVVAALLTPDLGYGATLLLASCGGFGALLLLLIAGRRSGFAPTQTLLVGIAFAALLAGVSDLLLAAADPRAAQLLAWLAGSTYAVTPAQAVAGVTVAAGAACVLPLAARALALLPLGEPSARALGLHVARSRLGVLFGASVATAAATLLVGPISFVGLMAPHLARALGARGALQEPMAAALLGALIMTLADWLGRMIAFPWQIPVGVMATAIGGLFFVWLMRAR